MTFENDWGMGWNQSRLGHVDGNAVCRGLGAPWVLWDTRLHDPSTMVKQPYAYPHGPKFVNQGIGPSSWDLDAGIYDYGFGGAFYVSGWKTYNWPNSFGTSGTPPFPANWPDIGGNPCDGGGVTLMMPVGEFAKHYISVNGNTPFFGGWDGFMDCMINCSPGGFFTDVFLTANWLGFMEASGGVPSTGDTDPYFDGFAEVDLANMYALLDFEQDDPHRLHINPENSLVTIHLDPVERRMYYWLNETPLLALTYDSDQQLRGWATMNTSCKDDYGGDPNGLIARLFCYMADGGPHVDFPPLGKAYNPVKGYALFRGCVPKQSDIAYWRNYWFPPGGGDQGVRTRIIDVRRDPVNSYGFGALLNNQAHSYEYTVLPGYTAAGFSFSAGGPRFGFAFTVAAGDVIRVELGGAGGDPGVQGGTAFPGAGGWPDGGNGGVNTLVNLAATGGHGSTRIYRNGVLYAIIAGAGGRPFNFRKSTGGWFSSHQGGGYGNPAVTMNGWQGFPNGAGAGQGATQVAPGAGGTGSPGGSGSVGGSAPTTTANDAVNWFSGGGGGGGGLFGGGAGASNLGAPTRHAGGGGGSHWFHPNIRDLTVAFVGSTSGTSASQAGVSIIVS